MFEEVGSKNTSFVLDLGDKFNTGSVVNMSRMFYNTCHSCARFNFKMGTVFDISNVTDMTYMFNNNGATDICLNKSSFNDGIDLSNVFAFSDKTVDTTVYVRTQADKELLDTKKVNAKVNVVVDSNKKCLGT
jgi:hypothetical protein